MYLRVRRVNIIQSRVRKMQIGELQKPTYDKSSKISKVNTHRKEKHRNRIYGGFVRENNKKVDDSNPKGSVSIGCLSNHGSFSVHVKCNLSNPWGEMSRVDEPAPALNLMLTDPALPLRS